MGLQLLDVEFRLLALTGPDDGAALLVDLHHENLGLFLTVTENFHEHVGDVLHQIHRIIMHDDIPRDVERSFLSGSGECVGISHRWEL